VNKKPLIIALVLIITAYLGNGIYYDRMKLEEGFFLNHDYELITEIRGSSLFELHYLDNRGESEKISWISVPGLDFIRMNQSYIRNEGAYVFQEIRTFAFDSSYMTDEQMQSLEGVEINKVAVHYSNGQSKEMPIGSIRFIKDESFSKRGSEIVPLENYSSGSSSTGAGFNAARASESLTITDAFIRTPISFSDAFCFEVEVTGTSQDPHTGAVDRIHQGLQCKESSFPIQANKDDTVWINHMFNRKAVPAAYTFATFSIQVTGMRENGESFTHTTHIRHQPSLSGDDIRSIIKQRRNAE